MGAVSSAFLIAGAVFTLIGGIGVNRFGDVMSRMHAAAKAPTLGLLLVATGAAIEIGDGAAIAALALVVILQLATSPVGTHMLGRASHRRVPVEVDDVDELARDRAARE